MSWKAHNSPKKKRPERHTEMTKCPKDGAAWSRPEPLAAGPRPAGGTSTWTRPPSSDTQVPTRHFHKDKVDSEPTARLTLSLSPTTGGLPPPSAPPSPPCARCRGLRRYLRRRRALTRYSHPFSSLPAIQNRAPNPNYYLAIWCLLPSNILNK